MIKRFFIIVADSFGIGEMPDAALFGDTGSDTLLSVSKSPAFHVPVMESLGLFNIDGVTAAPGVPAPAGAFARLAELSQGKDTTVGHWEMAGLVSEQPLPVYPHGFPSEIIRAFEQATGRKTLCNLPYSGTDALRDFGLEHVETGALIVYTSADSVFQIAAHEAVVPPELLYEYCRAARTIMTGVHSVGRIIARPFAGDYPDYKRTPNRHDFSLDPPGPTLLDVLLSEGFDTLAVGKISDIFAGRGISRSVRTTGNSDGMQKTIALLAEDFRGLCFVNLVDFDMMYGHRNDVDGYAAALSAFDLQLGEFLSLMQPDDALIVTADHGCDPGSASTDHSREYVPMLLYGAAVKPGVNLGTRHGFCDISASVLDAFGLQNTLPGVSFLGEARV